MKHSIWKCLCSLGNVINLDTLEVKIYQANEIAKKSNELSTEMREKIKHGNISFTATFHSLEREHKLTIKNVDVNYDVKLDNRLDITAESIFIDDIEVMDSVGNVDYGYLSGINI